MTTENIPKITSAAQVAANQRNAQRSTGPRTPEGKARSAQNPTRHGVFARAIAISSGIFAEDQDELDEFVDGVVRSLEPRGALEYHYASQVAERLVQMHRLTRVEAAGLTAAGGAASFDDPEQLLEHALGGLAIIDRTTDYGARLQRALDQALQLYTEVQARWFAPLPSNNATRKPKRLSQRLMETLNREEVPRATLPSNELTEVGDTRETNPIELIAAGDAREMNPISAIAGTSVDQASVDSGPPPATSESAPSARNEPIPGSSGAPKPGRVNKKDPERMR